MQTLRCLKYRYNVVFEIPSCSAIFLTGMLPFLYNASAIFAFSIAACDIPLGRPPFLPRARADFNPACVRSRINSRSNTLNGAQSPQPLGSCLRLTPEVTGWYSRLDTKCARSRFSGSSCSY